VQAQQDAEKNPIRANSFAEDLIKTSSPSLQIISHILPPKSPLNITVHDEVAFSLNQCVEIFLSKIQDWKIAIKILERALDFAQSNLAREKINRNLATCINMKAVNELNEMYELMNKPNLARSEVINIMNKLNVQLPEIHAALARALQLDPSNQTIRENLNKVIEEQAALSKSLPSIGLTQPSSSPSKYSQPKSISSTPTVYLTPAPIGNHLIAFFIDTLILFGIVIYNNLNIDQAGWLIFWYYFLLHLVFKRTIGEGLSGTRVVNRANLKRVSGISAFFRSGFYVLIIYIWANYWSWGFLLLLWPVLSSERRGLHDLLTGTILVK
jgi:uncharacterized RDD family membrane protein YckC